MYSIFLYEKTDKKTVLDQVNKIETLKDLYTRMEAVFNADPNLEREIQIQLSSTISQLYHAALNNPEGFCYKFSLPIIAIQSIFKKIKIPAAEAEEVFRQIVSN